MEKYEYDKSKIKEAWNASYKKVPDRVVKKSWEKFRFNLKLKAEKDFKEYNFEIRTAAALLLLLLVSYIFLSIKNPMVNVKNFSQVDKEVVLPDGSLVLLKPSAEIRYKKCFRDSRDVILKGEAFFKVEKDGSKEFKVKTASLTTKVLGTTFSVLEKEESKVVEIRLFTGRLAILEEDTMFTWNLDAGEVLLYREGKAHIEQFDTERSYKAGEAFLDLTDVQLERDILLFEKKIWFSRRHIKFP